MFCLLLLQPGVYVWFVITGFHTAPWLTYFSWRRFPSLAINQTPFLIVMVTVSKAAF